VPAEMYYFRGVPKFSTCVLAILHIPLPLYLFLAATDLLLKANRTREKFIFRIFYYRFLFTIWNTYCRHRS